MRIDKLLWFLRLAKTRPIAAALAEAGHIRLNGRRVERAHQKVACGDTLVLPLPRGVTVIEVTALPARRGPATEAQACYNIVGTVPPAAAHDMLDDTGHNPIAAPHEP